MSALDLAIFGCTAACERLAALADDLVPNDEQRTSLALELFRFLAVKRQLLAAPSPLGRLNVSPGGAVDELWHLMLLQTDVCDAVHAALGGDVPHSLADARLPDEDRVQRRLTALNLMQLGGMAPHLPFWQEAGTAMDSILAISHGGVTVYICPAMAAADAAAVTDTFLAAVAAVGLPIRGELAAMAAAAGVQLPDPSPPADLLQPQQRQPGRSCQAQEGGDTGRVQIFVVNLVRKFLTMDVDLAIETVRDLKLKIEGRGGVPVRQQSLVLAGRPRRPMEDSFTLREVGLQRESRVHMTVMLRGC